MRRRSPASPARRRGCSLGAAPLHHLRSHRAVEPARRSSPSTGGALVVGSGAVSLQSHLTWSGGLLRWTPDLGALAGVTPGAGSRLHSVLSTTRVFDGVACLRSCTSGI